MKNGFGGGRKRKGDLQKEEKLFYASASFFFLP